MEKLKKKIKWINLATVLIVIIYSASFNFLPGDTPSLTMQKAQASSCTSAGAGAWATVGTWSNCASTVPQVGDSVTVSHAVDIGDYTINEVANITIASGGTLTQSNINTQTISGTLTVESGGTLNHGNNSTTHVYEVDITAANIDVQSGGSINVYALGFDGGASGGGGANGYAPVGTDGEGKFGFKMGGGNPYGPGGSRTS